MLFKWAKLDLCYFGWMCFILTYIPFVLKQMIKPFSHDHYVEFGKLCYVCKRPRFSWCPYQLERLFIVRFCFVSIFLSKLQQFSYFCYYRLLFCVNLLFYPVVITLPVQMCARPYEMIWWNWHIPLEFDIGIASIF